MPRLITFHGRTQSIGAWSRELGIPEGTIRSRLDRLGQSVEQALGKPSDGRFRAGHRRGQVAPAPRPAPKILRDARGRAYSRWTDPITGQRRRRIWGAWGDPEAVRAYRRWAAEWIAGGGELTGQTVSVARLILRYLDYAEQHYRKHGRVTSEVYGIRAALRAVNDLYGDTPAVEFTPSRLMAVQAEWVRLGLSINTCNDYLHRVVRCWSWGVSRSLVPAAVADALGHVQTLRPGRTTAPAPAPRRAVPDADIEAAIPNLHPDPASQRVLEAILRLQRLTGMRPGEVLELRPCDIDRSREPWLYVPPSGGKTLHLERARRVWIGPRARALLTPWLAVCRPEDRVWQLPARRGGGLVPVRIEFLRWCLANACRRAGVPVFTPHQIRHTYATELHRRYEDDALVAAAIGDTPEVARHVYVDDPADATARRVAEAVG